MPLFLSNHTSLMGIPHSSVGISGTTNQIMKTRECTLLRTDTSFCKNYCMPVWEKDLPSSHICLCSSLLWSVVTPPQTSSAWGWCHRAGDENRFLGLSSIRLQSKCLNIFSLTVPTSQWPRNPYIKGTVHIVALAQAVRGPTPSPKDPTGPFDQGLRVEWPPKWTCHPLQCEGCEWSTLSWGRGRKIRNLGLEILNLRYAESSYAEEVGYVKDSRFWERNLSWRYRPVSH